MSVVYQDLSYPSLFDLFDVTGEIMNPRSRAVAIAFQRGLINNEELTIEEALLKKWLESEDI